MQAGGVTSGVPMKNDQYYKKTETRAESNCCAYSVCCLAMIVGTALIATVSKVAAVIFCCLCCCCCFPSAARDVQITYDNKQQSSQSKVPRP